MQMKESNNNLWDFGDSNSRTRKLAETEVAQRRMLRTWGCGCVMDDKSLLRGFESNEEKRYIMPASKYTERVAESRGREGKTVIVV